MCNCEIEYMKRRTGHLRAGTSDLTWGAEMWCMKACSTVIGSCLLIFLPTLRQLAMDIRWLSLFVLYLDSPSRTMPDIRSKQGSKSTACVAIRRPRGKQAVRPFRFLGKGASAGLQA